MPSVIGRRTIVNNDGIDLIEHEIEFEDGMITTQPLLHTSEVSLVIPIMENGDMIFIQQYRHTVDKRIIEFPAGKIEDAESPLDCAKRELLEEAGFSSSCFRQIASLYASPEFTDEIIHVFVADQLTEGCASPEPYERIQVMRSSQSQLLKLMNDAEYIKDSKTLAALFVFFSTIS